MALLSAPNELLIIIARYLDQQDVNSLVRTCSSLRTVLIDHLYQVDAQFSSSSALMWAARSDSLGTAKLSLQNGSNCDEKDGRGWTALQLAAQHGSESVVDELLSRGSKGCCFATQEAPLVLAAAGGHERIVEKLIIYTAAVCFEPTRIYDNALVAAAGKGHTNILRLLWEKTEADVNGFDETGGTAIMAAAGEGHIECLRILLACPGADVNLGDGVGWTPLIWAARGRFTETFELLMKQADIDVNKVENTDETPLHYAAKYGALEIAKLLIQNPDVDINARGAHGSRTPLHVASSMGYHKIVECLCERSDIDLNPRDMHGATPLILAAIQGHTETVKRLLRHDVDVNVATNEGQKTALIAAVDGGHNAIVECLCNVPHTVTRTVNMSVDMSWLCHVLREVYNCRRQAEVQGSAKTEYPN